MLRRMLPLYTWYTAVSKKKMVRHGISLFGCKPRPNPGRCGALRGMRHNRSLGLDQLDYSIEDLNLIVV